MIITTYGTSVVGELDHDCITKYRSENSTNKYKQHLFQGYCNTLKCDAQYASLCLPFNIL